MKILNSTIYIISLKYTLPRHHKDYQLPEEPPPPERPPPPEKPPPPELQDLPELPDPPELPDENEKPPIEAFPFVCKSVTAFLYHLVCFKSSLVAGKPIRYIINMIKVPLVPNTTIGNVAQKGIRKK